MKGWIYIAKVMPLLVPLSTGSVLSACSHERNVVVPPHVRPGSVDYPERNTQAPKANVVKALSPPQSAGHFVSGQIQVEWEVLKKIASDDPNVIPIPGLASHPNLPEAFKRKGVLFPEGASVSYIFSRGALYVWNQRSEIDKIRKIIGDFE